MASNMPASIKIRSADLAKFELVKKLILENIATHNPISRLSAQSGLNEYKLKVGFKLLYGTTLYGFLQDQRMKQAIHLLSVTEDSIQEIAAKCGYGYSTNFIAVFRKRYKLKPTHYRRSQAIHKTLATGKAQPCFTDNVVVTLYPQPVPPFRKTV